MGGLLYKDFASIKGKKIVTVLIAFTFVMITLKLIGVRTDLFSVLDMENVDGEHINLFDTFTSECVWFLIILGTGFINMWVSGLTEYDEKKKSMNYFLSLPISKNTYIASKYIFIGICYYVLLSLVFVWCIVSEAFIPEGFMQDMMMVTQFFSLEIICVALFISGIEISAYLIFGKARGQFIKTALINLLAIFVVAYLFFGDLDVFANWDIQLLIDWCEANSFAIMLLSTVSPFITLGLYYLCYRITVKVLERKEPDYE